MGQTIFADQLRTLRKQANYTQADVSLKLNIQRQTYSNYENASRTPPLEIIVAIAELYGVTVDYLVRGILKEETAPAAEPLSPEEKHLLEEFSHLSESSRREVLSFIRFKRLYAS